jgi:asparagine synthase (glutamine-hydrolysing)
MRGRMPDTLLDSRCKVGFNAPIDDFLDLSDRRIHQILLADSPVFDLVRRDKIQRLLTESLLPNSHRKFLFSFINAKFFLESFDQ